MAKSVLSAPHFQDEQAAFDYVEAHLWPTGPTCPHCGNADSARIGRLQGKTTRLGLRKCYECKKPFTVRQGTIFESSHLALHLWLQVIHLMCASKKGISTRQIQRMLQCSMKTAWHLSHRIRLAMTDGGLGSLGSAGEFVEVDETYIGKKADVPKRRGNQHKHVVLTLVERGGAARSFHIDKASAREIKPILAKHMNKNSVLMTDEAKLYIQLGPMFADHQTVNHVHDEWVRGDAHTNTVESFFSVFKRGMRGIYQQCDERHLHRYLAEFDFRHTNRERYNAKGEPRGLDDTQRATMALRGVVGKRLTYETVSRA
ncbi:IS1595 family transposase [Reyranella sp.]|uniref:IS1595 family transposase n=1 Tax=Reyranella sp. TaxID=1929291 RepID=UPI003D0A3F32